MEAYIARQPIFNNDHEVVAYELLYRNSLRNEFDTSISDNVATSVLLINSYLNFGINTLVGNHRAYINFGSHLIKAGIAELLDKNKVIIEVLETVYPDEKLLRQLLVLKQLGYNIALDDYSSTYDYPEIEEICNIVKIDFLLNSRSQIVEIYTKFRAMNKTILAEKIETIEAFEWAQTLGFDLYQGFYFAKPTITQGKILSESALQYVKIMNELNTEIPNYKRLSTIILSDVALTYKLLKLVNSKSRLVHEISSIKQGLSLLGVNEFSKWLSLAMVQNLCSKEKNELFTFSMIRSHFLQEIALKSDLSDYEDELALLGTLSVVDVILDLDMAVVLDKIAICTNVKDTLLGKATILTKAYRMCLTYEKASFDESMVFARSINYQLENLTDDYIKSVDWAQNINNELNSYCDKQ